MKATYTPPPSAEGSVVLELSESEARKLRIIVGSIGTKEADALINGGLGGTRRLVEEEFGSTGCTSNDPFRRFASQVYTALGTVPS